MTADWICLVAGPFIAGLVQLFKKWSIVAAYPKVVAFVLSAVIAGLRTFLGGSGFDWNMVIDCILVPFAAAVATYEMVKTAGGGT